MIPMSYVDNRYTLPASIFMHSKASLNFGFSFSSTGWLTKAKDPNLFMYPST